MWRGFELQVDPLVTPCPGTRLACHARRLMKLFERSAGEILWCAELLPPTFGVRVMLVDSFFPDPGGFGRLREVDAHALVHDRMPWKCVIDEKHDDARVLTRDPGVHRLMHAVNQ